MQRVIGIQLLFYVPSVGSDEQIRLLGWSESLIGASEVRDERPPPQPANLRGAVDLSALVHRDRRTDAARR